MTFSTFFFFFFCGQRVSGRTERESQLIGRSRATLPWQRKKTKMGLDLFCFCFVTFFYLSVSVHGRSSGHCLVFCHFWFLIFVLDCGEFQCVLAARDCGEVQCVLAARDCGEVQCVRAARDCAGERGVIVLVVKCSGCSNDLLNGRKELGSSIYNWD